LHAAHGRLPSRAPAPNVHPAASSVNLPPASVVIVIKTRNLRGWADTASHPTPDSNSRRRPCRANAAFVDGNSPYTGTMPVRKPAYTRIEPTRNEVAGEAAVSGRGDADSGKYANRLSTWLAVYILLE
jgi:hypothetical protein